MKKVVFFLQLVLLIAVLGTEKLSAQNYESFVPYRYQETVKGDMLLVGNSILNVGTTRPANAPYTGNHGYNSGINLQYADVDSDSSTFNSSSARVNNPNVRTACLKVKRAYLYWAAAYTQERVNNQTNPRFERSKFGQVKFKTPTQATYADLTGEKIYDGNHIVSDAGSELNSQRAYVYVADVTSYLQAEASRPGRNGAFDGDYTVANLMAPYGYERTVVGYAAGWTLVIIYEDQTQPSRHITLFDGFSALADGNSLDIPISGFQTIPSGTVNAKFAFAALEGESGITGDKLTIKSPSRPAGVLIDAPGRTSTGFFPNFFNSQITDLNGANTNRNPASTNLLGFDAGILKIPNAGNTLIQNNSTSATISPSTNRDAFYPFMMAFNVEVIAPVIDLEKKVYKVASNADVTGGTVDLGDILRYEIQFRNSGNDDARDLVITDKLPQNLIYTDITSSVKLSWKTTAVQPTDYQYNPATHEITFKIPNNIVKKGQTAWHKISFEVQVPPTCDDLRDACSNEISNIVNAKYFGVQNNSTSGFVAESVASHRDCEGNLQGPSTFIADLGTCASQSQEVLCARTLNLVAGANFDTYTWYKDGVLISGANAQTLTVSESGTYRVEKKKAGCADMAEVIQVRLHDAALAINPINQYASEVLRCGNDGSDYPQIYLCGTASSKLLNLNVNGALSYKWERRSESCTVPPTHPLECPVRDNYGCSWTQVHAGNSYNVSQAGDYRVEITYEGGCVALFYFKVTKILLDPTVEVRDMICGANGRITVTHPAAGYEYALRSSAGAIVQGYQDSNTFTITNPDAYTVLMRQKLAAGATYSACVFEVRRSVIKKDPTVTVVPTPLACANSKGTIRVQVTDAYPAYTYTIRRNNATGAIVAGATATNTSDITFTGLDDGNFYVEVKTPECTFTKTTQITKIPPVQARVTIKSHLMCNDEGIVRVDAWDGTPGTSYGYSIDGGATYYYNYTGSFYEFTVSNPGSYTIKVVDANGCDVTVVSDPVRRATPPTFNTTMKLVDCGAKGSIEFINVTNTDGYHLRYSIDGGATSQLGKVFTGLNPGTTYTPTLIYSTGTVDCVVSSTLTLPPATSGSVLASAGVAELVGCADGANADKARVRVTNVRGGTPPYQFSYDGGATWTNTREMWLLPGTYTVIARDAVECEHRSQVVVDPRPVNPVFTHNVTYNCDGTGNILVGNNQSTYTYTYTITGGGVNSTTSTPNFNSLPPGNYTIRVGYGDISSPTHNELFLEDFGVVPSRPTRDNPPNTTTPYINKKYFFEPQSRDITGIYANHLQTFTDGSVRVLNGFGNLQDGTGFTPSSLGLNDGEYVVTNKLNPNNGAWTAPNDPSGHGANGRMLLVNVGNILGTEGAILYQREMNDVFPNQPIEFSIKMFNLLKAAGQPGHNPTGGPPDLTIQLYTSEADILANNYIFSRYIGSPPHSSHPNDWHTYSFQLNPGNNNTLFAVLRSGSLVTNGNDVGLDDIYLYQLPRVCSFYEELNVTIEPDKAFGAGNGTSTDILCNDANNGTYQVALRNTAATGYWVSRDGAPFVQETANPFVWTGIAGGAHTVTFRFGEDTANCEVVRTFTINNPSAVVIAPIADMNIGCNPASVNLTVVASGGVGALRYAIRQPDGTLINQNTPNFTLTQAGTYSLTVTDANNCPTTVQFNVIQAPTPTIAVAPTSNYCVSAGTQAHIDVTVTDGTAPFTYAINGSVKGSTTDANYSFAGLTPGTYTITVTDSFGCVGTLAETIQPELRVAGAAVEKEITCDPLPVGRGIIKVNITGGYAPYQYEVIKDGAQVVVARTSTGGNDVTFQSEEAGVYTIRIYDSKNCETSTALTLTAPAQPTFTHIKTDVNCYGDNTGAIVINVSAGAAPYRYFLNGVDRGSQNTFNNLAAGTYTVTVRDAKNCETSEAIIIAQPTAPLAINAVITKLISCDPASDKAEVSYSVSGGTPNYNDNQGGTNYGTVTRTISLGVGTHSIIVTDAKGCQTQTTIEIPRRPDLPTVNTTPAINYNCDGTGNFTITATPNTYEYTYRLGGESNTTGTFNNVSVGSHQIGIYYKEKNPVQGAEDCGYTMTVTVVVDANQEFKAAVANVINASCAGANDGQVTLNVQNYGSGYTYSVNGGASQNGNSATLTLPNLSTGAYTITLVYDTCTLDVPATVTEPASLVATPTITVPAKCSNNQRATVMIQAAGGTVPYTYTFNGVTLNTNVFTQVPVGTHTFIVTDKNGCSVNVPVEVEAPQPVTFTAVPTACYSGNNDAEVVVTVTGGNGDYRFSINNGAWQVPASTSSLTYTFTGLPSSAGHIIRVEDGFGCQSMTTVVIHPRLIVNTKETSVSCHNGNIEVTASGGDGTYQYAFVPSGSTAITYGTANTYAVTTAGAYDVYVQSAACVYSTTVTVNQATPVSFTATVKEPNCFGYTGSIGLTNIVGDAPYTLNLYDQAAPTTPITTVPNYINTTYEFVGLTASSTYIVTVTDKYGCIHTDTLTINGKPELTAVLESKAVGCVVLGQSVPVALTVSQTLIDTYAAPNYTLQYSIDGLNWTTITATVTIFTDQVGNSFTPQLQVKDASGNIVCLQTLPKYTVPFPLSELAVATNLETGFTGTCTPGGFTVVVTASGGILPFQFSMGDPNDASSWHNPTPANGSVYTFTGLTPGRSYTFYVKDSRGCIEQNRHDIYDGYIPPIRVVGNVKPICNGTSVGSIDFVISRTASSTAAGPNFDWVLINKTTSSTVANGTAPMPVIGSTQTVTIPNLPLGIYYMQIKEHTTNCEWASKDVEVYEQTELNGTPNVIRDVTCELPGLLEIQNPYGGGGTYTFELTSPAFVQTMTVSSTTIQIPISNINAVGSAISIDVRMIDQYGCGKPLGRVNMNVAPSAPTPTAIPNSCEHPLSISVTPAGANYQYAIKEASSTTWSPWQVSEVFTNLTAGSYEVALRDVTTGCVASSTSVTLYTKIEAEVTQNSLLGCGATASATIQIKASEGSGNYEYAVSGAATVARTALPTSTYNLTANVAGTYVISLWDAHPSASTCPPLTFTVTVAPPVYPAFTASTVSATCHGYADGMILINEISTGAPSVTYTLTGPTAATYSATIKGFAGLTGGSAYQITATASNGCATTTTVNVGQPPQIFVNPGVVSVTQFGCASGNSPESAVVTINPSAIRGGTPPYSFVMEYNGQTVTGTTLITNDHTGGTVTITITDSNGCAPLTITTTRIDKYDAITGISINVTDPIACGTTSGENVDVVVTSVLNLSSKFEYVQSATTPSATAAWQPSRTFTNLAVGTYTFWVRHIETGCMTSVTHTVKEPNTFTIDKFTIVNPVVCRGSSAVVTFDIQDATYTRTYNVSVLGTPITANRTGSGVVTLTIQAGTYTLSVTQASHPGCTNEYPFVVPGPDADLTATITVQNITCVPGNNGAIEVINVTGGWGGYEYRITPATTSVPSAWGTNPLFGGLSPDTYRIEIRDSGGCVYTITQQLSNPRPIVPTLAVTSHNCTEGTGVLVATASGGEGKNYSFQLIKDGVNYGSAVGTTTNTVTFSNLSSGQYLVAVSDTWGCVATLTTPITLYEPITNANVRIDKEITCTSPTGANVTVLHQGGNSGNITYVVTPPSGTAITQNNNPVFTNLNAAGTYNVSITDNATGCSPATATFELTPTIPVAFTHTKTNVSCNGGNDGSMGIIVDNTQTQLDYVIRVTSSVAGFTTQSKTVSVVPATHYFTGLKAGTYVVTLTSERGCVSTTTVTITEPTALGVTASVTTAFACDASNVPQQAVIQAVATGGTAPFNYSIDGMNFNNTTGTFTITDTGAVQNITVYVKDAEGCDTSVPLTVNPLPKITNVGVSPVTAISCQGPEVVRITIAGGSGVGFVVEATSAAGSAVTPPTQTLPAGTLTADFNLPEPGQYEFKIIDSGTECYETTSYVVNPYNLMTATASPTKSVSCTGTANGEITLTTVNYTGTYTWEVLNANTLAPLSPANAGTANSPVFATPVTTVITGLPEGQYVIRIVQGNAPFCTVTSTVVQIATPGSPLTVTSTLANPLTCAGGDAIISAQAQGGWGGHQYRLDVGGTAHPVYGTYTTTSTFAGLSAGNYTIWAKDKEGCETSTTVALADPDPITVSITPSVTMLACYGDKTASVTGVITSAGGSGNYKYVLLTRNALGTIIESGAQDSPTFTGLGAGEYAIRVIDGWNCDADSAYITIGEPTQVQVQAAITRGLTCLQQAQITVTATGGSGTGYTYTVDPSSTGAITQSSAGVFSAGPGRYVFTAVDGNGCPSGLSNEIEIHPIENLGLNIDTTAAYVKCNGDSSATIKAEAYGGLGNYQYELLNASGTSLTPPVTNTDGIFAGLATGTYHVKVTSDDCEYTTMTPIVINEAPPLVVVTATSTNETCFGEKDGTIDVEVTGGTGTITYAISPRLDRVVTADYIRAQKFEPGNYVVIAQDANGCTLEFNFNIIAASQISVTLVTSTDETCLGSNDGTATITVTGGMAPYSTAFNDNSPTANWVPNKFFYDNLPAGQNHAIFVKDANGCIAHVIIPEIKPGVDLQLSAEAKPECTNNNNVINNRIVVSVNPLHASQVSYALDGGTPQSSNIFDGVSAGVHTITVSHPGGCVKEVSVEVKHYDPLSVVSSTTEITCNNANDAVINFQVTGGSASYTYTITPAQGNFDPVAQRFTALPPGNYTVTVRDNVLGCMVSGNFNFINPDLLTITTGSVSETCYGDSDGQIQFTIGGGRPTYSYVLTNAQGQTVASANGIGAGHQVTQTGLAPGTYVITYVDQGGVCTQTTTVTVGAAPNLRPVSLEVKYECTATTPSNYLEVVFDNTILNHSNAFYALNSINITDARRFTEFNGYVGIIRNLPVGSDHYITIFYNTCSYTIPVSQYFDVEDYDALTLQNISDPQKMNQIKVQASGGKAPYTYYFNGKTSGDGNEYYVSLYDPGYTDANGRIIKQVLVTVVDDLGCTQTLTIEKEFVDIDIPNYFTPNGDGNNDGWSPRNTRSYPNIQTDIFDRYGRKVATIYYGETWDGKYQGLNLPTGDYWYIVRLREDRDDSREFIGNFTLFR